MQKTMIKMLGRKKKSDIGKHDGYPTLYFYMKVMEITEL